jgi:hypothetical protein
MSTDASRNISNCLGSIGFLVVSLVAVFNAPATSSAASLVIEVQASSGKSLEVGQRQLSLSDALLMARNAREQDPSVGPIIIELSAGIHRLSRPVEITAADSGTPSKPLVIRSAQGAIARIFGSRPVSQDDAEYLLNLNKAHSTLLRAGVRSKVRVIHLNENELAQGKPQQLTFQQRIAPVEVYQKSRPLTMARWPKSGFEHSLSVLVGATKAIGPKFSIPLAKAAAWIREPSLWAGGYWGQDWYFETAPVSKVDTERGAVTLFPLKANYLVRPGLRYFIYNAASELVAPGEYFVDWEARRLIVWPYDDNLSRHPIEIASAEHLLELHGAGHIRIEGIGFENTRGDAIQIKDSIDITLENCLVTNVGGNGILIERGQNVNVVRSVIADTGEAGIILSGGDRATLTPANHGVHDSILVGFGRLARTYRPGVELFGVGQIVEGSYFADAPHAAIIFHGNDHRIIGNEITRVAQETSDAGAIYAGRDWTARGTIIAENYIHNIAAIPGTNMEGRAYEVKGVYLDDLLSGIAVRRNLFINVMQPVFIGGGRDNDVSSNIFINPGVAAIHVDDRGLTWAAHSVNDSNGEYLKSLFAVPYRTEPYRSRYPGLANILDDEPGSPKNNHIGPNIVLGGSPQEMSPAVMRLQKLGPVLDERAIGIRALPKNPSALLHFLGKSANTFLPPFDLPFAKMDRKSALKDLKFFTRSGVRLEISRD